MSLYYRKNKDKQWKNKTGWDKCTNGQDFCQGWAAKVVIKTSFWLLHMKARLPVGHSSALLIRSLFYVDIIWVVIKQFLTGCCE